MVEFLSIDRKAGEIIRLVACIRPSAHLKRSITNPCVSYYIVLVMRRVYKFFVVDHAFNLVIFGHAEKLGYSFIDLKFIYIFQPGVINTRMTWHGKLKKQASFFMGTSPEFDISIYTLCILTRTNRNCNLEINNAQVSIRTYDVSHYPGLQVATAFLAT